MASRFLRHIATSACGRAAVRWMVHPCRVRCCCVALAIRSACSSAVNWLIGEAFIGVISRLVSMSCMRGAATGTRGHGRTRWWGLE